MTHKKVIWKEQKSIKKIFILEKKDKVYKKLFLSFNNGKEFISTSTVQDYWFLWPLTFYGMWKVK